MIWLLGILLFIGFIQSWLSLKKDGLNGYSNSKKKRISQSLSILYVIGFIAGIANIILQKKEENVLNELTIGIYDSVNEVDIKTSQQINMLNQALKNSQILFSELDSIDSQTKKILEERTELLMEYEELNKSIKKQIIVEREKIIERRPIIDVNSLHANWDYKPDSTSHYVEICAINIGHRVAEINKGKGYILFFNKDNKPIKKLDIVGQEYDANLEAFENTNVRFCYISHGIYGNIETTKYLTKFAVIVLEISYTDYLTNKKYSREFFLAWSPESGFGGTKDWQKDLAKKWKENN